MSEDETAKKRNPEPDWLKYVPVISALISLMALGALVVSVDNARRATIEANRAWIATTKAVVEGPEDDSIYVTISITDPGRQPALDETTSTQVDIIDPTTAYDGMTISRKIANQNICDGEHPTKGSNAVYPSSPDTMKTNVFPSQSAIYKAVIAKKQGLLIRMCNSYTTFGEEHHTASCYFYVPGRTRPDKLIKCDGGQFAD